MQLFHDLPTQPLARPTVLTIGNFDGVHRGHQALIAHLLESAHGQSPHSGDRWAGVITFDPHPLTVLAPQRTLPFLTNLDERLELLAALALDFVVLYPFTAETAQTSARVFATRLSEQLHLSELWVGPDFTLGRQQEGNAAALTTLGQELGFGIRVVPPYCLGGQSVRSTRIRTLLLEGEVQEAADLLGRPYRVSGEVIEGANRGGPLGFPTVNLAMESGRVLPRDGTYAGWATEEGCTHPAAINVGVRPTFEPAGAERIVEAHLLSYDGCLFGKTVALTFVQRLRAEVPFESPELWAVQMDRDVARTRHVLGLGKSKG
ncbi:MAG TPA: riboflavin biosynthesis protein RibF [Anaerolineae bacterium]|nr:riboflavin biosynthesis protein RibF [Anaerolineae bacterium]